MVSRYGPPAYIQPDYEPELFFRVFGKVDMHKGPPNLVITQKERVHAWDAAIEFAVLRQPIQQPVLTNPQPKGD